MSPKYKKRGKRTYKRTKRFSRKKRMFKNTLLNKIRYFKHKLVATRGVKLGGAAGDDMTSNFYRYAYENTTLGHFGINSAPRWAQVKANYESYIITGFKIQYIPAILTGAFPLGSDGLTAISNPVLQRMEMWEDIDTLAIDHYTPTQIWALDSFKTYDISKPFTFYRNNKPLAFQMKSAWQDTKQNEVSLSNNSLPRASVCLKARGTHMGPIEHTVGVFRVTYYVTFKG